MTQAYGPALPDGWRLVRFDQVLTRIERRVLLDDLEEYSTIGVRWYGKGAFVRDRLLGADIARKQQWVIRQGDIVYNKLFAWKGAFAVADEIVDGHLVSDKFPTYSANSDEIDPSFLALFFQTPRLAFQAERLSKGAAAISKLTLNPPQFWNLTIPLPSRREQRRLAALLDEARKGIDEAKQSREYADAESAALITSSVGQLLSPFPITGCLGEVLDGKPRNGWSARCDNVETGTPVLSLGAVTGFVYRSTEFKRTLEPTSSGAHYWMKPGDLLMTRSNTERLVGHAAIYDGEPSPCIYPDLMMRVPVDRARADTRFVYYWLRTPLVRSIIERAGSGTSSSMKKITQGDVMGLPFPTDLSAEEQHAVARRMDAIADEIDTLRGMQRSTRADLDALFPALLDRAFSGRLIKPAAATTGVEE